MKELAEARGFTEEFLSEHGIKVDDNPDFPIVITYPHMTGVWYERRRRALGDGRQPKYHHPKGEDIHLFNPLRLGPNAGMVWFAEGEFDALALIAQGIPAIGVPGASSFRRVARHLFSSALVVIAFDADPAGREASAKTAGVFAQDKTRVFEFDPGDGMDLNELHVAGTLRPRLEGFAEEYGLDLWPEDEPARGEDTEPVGPDTPSVPEDSDAGPDASEGEDDEPLPDPF